MRQVWFYAFMMCCCSYAAVEDEVSRRWTYECAATHLDKYPDEKRRLTEIVYEACVQSNGELARGEPCSDITKELAGILRPVYPGTPEIQESSVKGILKETREVLACLEKDNLEEHSVVRQQFIVAFFAVFWNISESARFRNTAIRPNRRESARARFEHTERRRGIYRWKI